ncbi:Penicillin-binding protein 4* [Massilia sp. Bi118]|uniref:serine hydrolase domain-containing protein n=1 Tax=Massilia sp. Bi118 TaxID=2822346 RepID=UPI001D4F513F|nr:serine hydrolase [Massilia sp. Bi118]CAH0249775.1 Penicillin-binding protein 4* [Massilia sp. Bi118]
MNQGRRTLLGMALLGMIDPLRAATPASGRASSSAMPVALKAKLDQELAAIVANPACELASLSVLAIRDGRIAYEAQFGQRFIGAGGVASKPVDSHTLFRIASISKMMTTLGLMRLVEAGKVDLDADVSTYLGFSLRNPHFPDQPIVLRHLLTHTSSLRDEAGYSWGTDVALKDVLVPGSRLHGEGKMWAANAGPGAYFTYCNLGWGVIGTIMERVTSERFDRLMRRLLVEPLGLHAGYNPSELPASDVANIATLYRKRTVDTEVWDANGPWIAQADDYSRSPPAPAPGIERYVIGANATPFSPTGGMRISAHDMGVIMQMLMNGGVHEGQRILQKATLDRMFARQWTYDGKGGNGDSLDGLFNCWGLGNEQFPDDPATRTRLVEGGGFAAVGHLGDAYGLMSVFAADLKNRNGMVALVGGTSTDPLAYKGAYSSLARFQEQILTAMHRRAILVRA